MNQKKTPKSLVTCNLNMSQLSLSYIRNNILLVAFLALISYIAGGCSGGYVESQENAGELLETHSVKYHYLYRDSSRSETSPVFEIYEIRYSKSYLLFALFDINQDQAYETIIHFDDAGQVTSVVNSSKKYEFDELPTLQSLSEATALFKQPVNLSSQYISARNSKEYRKSIIK